MKQICKLIAACVLAGSCGLQAQQPQASAARLHIFFVDVEGGQATLFVPPGGDSLLIDTGWPDHDGRDAKRIVAVAHQAGLTRIDTVLITHFHDDHVGGVPQLAALIPIGTFIDHGPNRELDHGDVEHNYAEYSRTLASTGARHLVAKVGEKLPIRGLQVTVASADGDVLSKPLPGGGQLNPFCATSPIKPPDVTENGRSLGVVITFGRFRILDLGDLTWDRERTLMCPVNRLGHIDLNIVSHHGWYQSSSPALVDAIGAQVAIMDNGATKGGSPATFKTLTTAPQLKRLWQLHFSEEGGSSANTADEYIANPHGADGNFIEVTADTDGRWSARNSRTGFSESYKADEGVKTDEGVAGTSSTGPTRPSSNR